MAGASPDWRVFPSSEALAEALAGQVAERLREALRERDAASLAVSGGSTPGLFFDMLSRQQLDWTKVVVTLVDERFVPSASPRSNERLVRERLLINEARLARFVPLRSHAQTIEQAARQAESGIALVPRPLDAVILGMGSDGHTASFFPDAGNIADLLDRKGRRLVMAVDAASAGEPRLTLTLPVLLDARFLALHIEGTEKRAVLKRALEGAEGAPVAAVFRHSEAAVPIYWSE